MNEQPLVTVNILSFNRREELSTTLTKVCEQDYKNIEIIVVDNASSDGSAEMVKTEFPLVKLIQLQKNIGIAGWNEGFKVAKGEFILVLDDDSYPENGTICKAVDCIQNDSKIGIVCLPVFNNRFKGDETDYINKEIPNTFIGCGALIRKSIFTEVGYFNELLFLYEHETEFSMRVIDSGYNLKYCRDAIIIHREFIIE